MYQLWVDVWTGRSWTVEKYNLPYDTFRDAQKALEYIGSRDNELSERLTIREIYRHANSSDILG